MAAFEKSRSLLVRVLRTRVDPPQRVRAIVLRRRSELAEFVDAKVLGLTTFDERGPLIVAASTAAFVEAAPDLRTMTHELTHLFAAHAFARQPRWFAEGLAGYFETMVPGSGTRLAEVGAPNLPLLEFVRYHGVLPLETLWAWPTAGLDEAYASSWAWVHFLSNRYPEAFASFELALADAVEPRQAWTAAFASHPAQRLERELQGYLESGAYDVTQVPLDERSVHVTTQPLSNAEVHALRARLRLLTSDGAQAHEHALADVTMALRLDPMNVQATELRVQTALASERLALARAFLEQHPMEPTAWKLLARALPQSEAREAWREALARAPDDTEALLAVARGDLLAFHPDLALPLLTRVVVAEPWNTAAFAAQAIAFAVLQRCDEALDAHLHAQEVMPDDAPDAQRHRVEEAALAIRSSCRAPRGR